VALTVNTVYSFFAPWQVFGCNYSTIVLKKILFFLSLPTPWLSFPRSSVGMHTATILRRVCQSCANVLLGYWTLERPDIRSHAKDLDRDQIVIVHLYIKIRTAERLYMRQIILEKELTKILNMPLIVNKYC